MKGLLLTALLLGAPARASEDVQVVVGGRVRDAVAAYRSGGEFFLNARDVAALYGGQSYWYPVAGRVELSFRGRRVQLLVNADTASTGSRTFKLKTKVLSRAGAALVPMSFLLSAEFCSWIGVDAKFNPKTRLLTLDAQSSVGSPRWFSYPDKTRIEMALAPGLTYSSKRRGLKGFDVTVPLGTIASSEKAEVEDGIVGDFSLRQDAKVARLSVALSKPGSAWSARIAQDPRRLVVDVYREGVAAPPAREEVPAPARIAKAQTAPSSAPAVSVATAAAVLTPEGRPKRRIVVDAGHGGKDSGATGRRGTLEKDINLLAATELANLLREEGAFDVLLTRADDTFVPLGDRSRMANEYNADLFVSLHCNASPNKKEAGFEVYFLSEKASTPEAARLAEFENSVVKLEGDGVTEDGASRILVAMAQTEHMNEASELAGLMARAVAKRSDIALRGVKQADFYVLRGTDAPAVLFEMAFVTNGKDEAKLETAKARRRVVEGIYAGLLDYAKAKGWL